MGNRREVEFIWGEGEVLRKYIWSYPVSSTIYKGRAQKLKTWLFKSLINKRKAKAWSGLRSPREFYLE